MYALHKCTIKAYYEIIDSLTYAYNMKGNNLEFQYKPKRNVSNCSRVKNKVWIFDHQWHLMPIPSAHQHC